MVVDCADTIWVYPLSMEGEEKRNWRNVRDILDRHFPEMAELYRQIAFSSNHLYWGELGHDLEELQTRGGLDLRIKL